MVMVKQLLFADSIPGRPRPVGRPHYTWMDVAMQDLRPLGPRQLLVAGLRSFNLKHQAFSSSLAVF